jgi:mannose-6-phosphate isomerase-like protein (cupin superfamily)
MTISNWRDQAYNVIGSVLFNNPTRAVRFLVQMPDGEWLDRECMTAPVRRLADTPVPDERNCLRTIQFVHHVLIPPGGRHVMELHVHPDAEELILISQGEGVFILDGEESPVRTGDVAYVPPNAAHELRNTSEELLGAFFINVPVGDGLQLLLDIDPRHSSTPE